MLGAASLIEVKNVRTFARLPFPLNAVDGVFDLGVSPAGITVTVHSTVCKGATRQLSALSP
jgi:hypothetical protein